MKNLYQITRHLVWLTQFGLSVALPPVLFLLGAVWLKNEFAWAAGSCWSVCCWDWPAR